MRVVSLLVALCAANSILTACGGSIGKSGNTSSERGTVVLNGNFTTMTDRRDPTATTYSWDKTYVYTDNIQASDLAKDKDLEIDFENDSGADVRLLSPIVSVTGDDGTGIRSWSNLDVGRLVHATGSKTWRIILNRDVLAQALAKEAPMNADNMSSVQVIVYTSLAEFSRTAPKYLGLSPVAAVKEGSDVLYAVIDIPLGKSVSNAVMMDKTRQALVNVEQFFGIQSPHLGRHVIQGKNVEISADFAILSSDSCSVHLSEDQIVRDDSLLPLASVQKVVPCGFVGYDFVIEGVGRLLPPKGRAKPTPDGSLSTSSPSEKLKRIVQELSDLMDYTLALKTDVFSGNPKDLLQSGNGEEINIETSLYSPRR